MAMPQYPAVLVCNPSIAARREQLAGAGFTVVTMDELQTEADRAAVGAIFHMGLPMLDAALLQQFPNLKIVAFITAGYESVDLDWCRSRGIAVTHAKGLNADDVADVGFGLMLSVACNLSRGERMVRDGRWFGGAWPQPRRSLAGQKLGIVGLGDIGVAFARRAEAFRMEVSWWGPRPKPDAAWPRAETLLDLARASDVLAVCSRATPDNEKMVSREVIEALGPQGVLVNVARGSLVDEDALIEALKDGRLGGAGLDVFAQEPTPAERWASLDNAVLTPHFAGASIEAIVAMRGQAVENLRRSFAGEPLLSPVQD